MASAAEENGNFTIAAARLRLFLVCRSGSYTWNENYARGSECQQDILTQTVGGNDCCVAKKSAKVTVTTLTNLATSQEGFFFGVVFFVSFFASVFSLEEKFDSWGQGEIKLGLNWKNSSRCGAAASLGDSGGEGQLERKPCPASQLQMWRLRNNSVIFDLSAPDYSSRNANCKTA